MKFSEVEQKCERIYSTKKQLDEQLTKLHKLESEAREKSKEAQMLEEIAKLRGEEFAGKGETEELEKAREAANGYRDEIRKLEQGVYEGLKDITFDIPLEVPRVDPQGRSTITFEGGPYNHAVRFIASTMSSDVPLELDKTQLHPDKIVVNNVKESSHVIERLRVLHDNIGRLARIALREKDPDLEEIVDYLSGSDYRKLWEAIKGRKRVSYNDLFSDLGISKSKDKRRVYNFFINLEHLLKERCPFIRVKPGVYEITFFGSLVWKRYCDKFPTEEIAEKARRETIVETAVKEEEKKKAEAPSLNKFLSNNEVKEVIYGKEVS